LVWILKSTAGSYGVHRRIEVPLRDLRPHIYLEGDREWAHEIIEIDRGKRLPRSGHGECPIWAGFPDCAMPSADYNKLIFDGSTWRIIGIVKSAGVKVGIAGTVGQSEPAVPPVESSPRLNGIRRRFEKANRPGRLHVHLERDRNGRSVPYIVEISQ